MSANSLGGLRADLAARRTMTVAMVTIPDSAVAFITARAGFDLVVLDAEHGPFDLSGIRACLDALSALPCRVAVRVRGLDADLIKQVLDLGPGGIIVPNIRSGAEAAELVASVRYPPDGVRGIGAGRAQAYGLDPTYRDRANGEIAAIAIIESRVGAGCAAEILATPGLDGVLIGTSDLAADYGGLVRDVSAEVSGAVASVLRAADDAGIAVGLPAAYVLPPDAAQVSLPVIFADHAGLADAASAAIRQFETSRTSRDEVDGVD
jgi:4-hydroxy-2-oxoheptanedioate aldolase